MRICHVVGDSRFGGGSKMISRIASAAQEQGHDVTVVATDPEFCAHIESLGVATLRLECIWRSIHPPRDLLGFVRLHRHFGRASYDLVHTHTSKAGFVGRAAARAASVRSVVHTVHGFAFHERSNPVLLHGVAMLERLASRWCDRLVMVSDFHRRWALELGIGNSHRNLTIANGVAEPAGLDDEHRSRVRAEFEVADDELLLLSAGRLAAGKGLEDLIEAAAIVSRHDGPRVRVVMPGAGPQERELEDLVAARELGDTVLLPGFRRDIGALLAASDAVVLPSYREGLSIALLEAMAAGKPIIASTIGSNLEATADGTVAHLVDCGDPTQLAAAIRALAASPKSARELGERARRRWREHYTENRMVDSYLALYDELEREADERRER